MTSNKSNQPTPNQVDAFVSAATDGEVAKLDTLLAQQPRLIDAHTPQGMTALFAASYSNQLHAARWFVDGPNTIVVPTSRASSNRWEAPIGRGFPQAWLRNSSHRGT